MNKYELKLFSVTGRSSGQQFGALSSITQESEGQLDGNWKNTVSVLLQLIYWFILTILVSDKVLNRPKAISSSLLAMLSPKTGNRGNCLL